MNQDSPTGSVGALLALVLVMLLIVGGAAFYLVTERQQRALAVAREQARATEEVARAQAKFAQAEADRNRAEAAAKGSAADERQTADDNAIRDAIESVLRTQQDAWNRGDIDAFVEHYWNSEDVTFSSGGKTARGWESTVRSYRERYPTREAMGRLTFNKLEITPLGDAALVLGEWRLERESEPLSGNFSLVFRKLDGRWVIVHDHTSRLAE
jgi:ketosteroid isomerase-like protein